MCSTPSRRRKVQVMATVTVHEEEQTVTTIVKTITVVLSEAEATRVAERLQVVPKVLGDDGGEIGLSIQFVL